MNPTHDHEDSSTQLTDLLAGRLSGERAAAAWAHLGTCPDCQAVASVIHRVREAVGPAAQEIAAEHPRSEDLVAFALGDVETALDVLARVRIHLDGCAECRRAVALTRGAEARTGRGPDWIAGVLDRLRAWWTAPRLAPALAVVAVLLAYPAWVGLVRHPSLTREAEQMRRDLAARATVEPAPAPTPRSPSRRRAAPRGSSTCARRAAAARTRRASAGPRSPSRWRSTSISRSWPPGGRRPKSRSRSAMLPAPRDGGWRSAPTACGIPSTG